MKPDLSPTARYILETVAPIFNRQGYVGTSLSDLTEATKLTKGAIYGNFKNKEDLALKAFYFNFEKSISPLLPEMATQASSIEKLLAVSNYYKNYYHLVVESGGCPLLNVSSDAKFNNPKLFEAAKKVANSILEALTTVIQTGIEESEIKQSIHAESYSKSIFSMIQGGIFLALTNENESFLTATLERVDALIIDEMKR